MRVVVTGATGNVGTSVLDALGGDDAVTSILGIARRLPAARFAKTEFAVGGRRPRRPRPAPRRRRLRRPPRLADPALARRGRPFAGRTWTARSRTFAAVVAAGVPALVVASSVGAYSAARRRPAGRRELADRGDPGELVLAPQGRGRAPARRARGRTSRPCGSFACDRRSRRSARPRAASAASSQARSFPTAILRPGWIPFVAGRARPDAAARPCATTSATPTAGRSSRTLAAPSTSRASLCSIRPRSRTPSRPARCGCPPASLRGAARATWLARLQPTSPDWIDLALGAPVLDTARARSELGWAPTRNAVETLREVVAGMREHAGRGTPPLESSRKR